MEHDLEQNKRTAIAFYDLMFNQGRPSLAVLKYVGDEYIQHNPNVRSGKEAFIGYMDKMADQYPEKRAYVQRVIAEGDLVVVHSRQEWPGDLEWATIDIYRFDDNGKIVEHWDVLQQVPPVSANQNTMF